MRCMAGSAVSTRYNFAHNAMHILACTGMIAGIRCHVSMVLEWQLNIVCAAVLGCSHLLLIATTASAQCSVRFAP